MHISIWLLFYLDQLLTVLGSKLCHSEDEYFFLCPRNGSSNLFLLALSVSVMLASSSEKLSQPCDA